MQCEESRLSPCYHALSLPFTDKKKKKCSYLDHLRFCLRFLQVHFLPPGFRGVSTFHLHENTTTWEKTENTNPLAVPCQLPDLCPSWVFASAWTCWGGSLRSTHKLKKQSPQDNLQPGVRVCVPGLRHLLRSDWGRILSLLKVLLGKHCCGAP